MTKMGDLHRAAESDDVATVVRLLALGSDIEELDDSFETPLRLAADAGHLSVVRALVESGADVNAEDPYLFRTALMYAAGHGHEQVVRYLASKGATVDTADDFGDNALHRAVDGGHLETVRALIELGADPMLVGELGTPLQRARCGLSPLPELIHYLEALTDPERRSN